MQTDRPLCGGSPSNLQECRVHARGGSGACECILIYTSSQLQLSLSLTALRFLSRTNVLPSMFGFAKLAQLVDLSYLWIRSSQHRSCDILKRCKSSMARPTPTLLKHASSSARWLTRQQSDPFVRARAGAQGDADTLYRSRSSFKLQSMAKKYPCLLPKGGTIIDLGAAPGKHSQKTQVVNSLTRCFAPSESASK